MAIDEFFLSLRVAVPAEQLARGFAGSGNTQAFDAWLTRAVVAGFEREDLANRLTARQLEQLTEAVTAFRQVADEVPERGRATQVQSEEGLRQLQTILSLVQQLPEWAGG